MKHEGDLIITAINANEFLVLVEVTGYLHIRAYADLPALTKVGGFLYVRADAKLPVLVEVTGSLDVRAYADLPALTKVGGFLSITADANLPKLTHAYGVDGVLICTCGYGLWLSDEGYYYAGCRKKFTKEKALRHWNRRDERAVMFTKAILGKE
jgi:hypothetical protein